MPPPPNRIPTVDPTWPTWHAFFSSPTNVAAVVKLATAEIARGRRFASRSILSNIQPEELVTELFTRVSRRAGPVSDVERELRSFLRYLLIRKVRTLERARRRDEGLKQSAARYRSLAPKADPLSRLMRQESLAELERALQRFTSDEVDAIQPRLFGMSGQISRVSQTRARKRLKLLLEAEHERADTSRLLADQPLLPSDESTEWPPLKEHAEHSISFVRVASALNTRELERFRRQIATEMRLPYLPLVSLLTQGPPTVAIELRQQDQSRFATLVKSGAFHDAALLGPRSDQLAEMAATAMNLQTFADSRLQGRAFSAPARILPVAWAALHAATRSEAVTDPTIAAILSQVVMLSRQFESAMRARGLSPGDTVDRDVFLLRTRLRDGYMLVIADARLGGAQYVEEVQLTLSLRSLSDAMERWESSTPARPVGVGELFDQMDKLALLQPSIAFIHRPTMIKTSSPVPAWAVSVSTNGGRATAGCVVRCNCGCGKEGVTTARHAFAHPAAHASVTVDGVSGLVHTDDAVSDSVFVEMSTRPIPASSMGVAGYLSGVSPRLNAPASFCGATSGSVTTAVQSIDPSLLQVSRTNQSRVYTPAVTNPGDSGAALIEDSSDHVIAFAHERTPAGAFIEWSSWIWADSVFSALNIKPC